MFVGWLACYVLTESGVFASAPGGFGYASRTYLHAYVLSESPWFRASHATHLVHVLCYCCSTLSAHCSLSLSLSLLSGHIYNVQLHCTKKKRELAHLYKRSIIRVLRKCNKVSCAGIQRVHSVQLWPLSPSFSSSLRELLSFNYTLSLIYQTSD